MKKGMAMLVSIVGVILLLVFAVIFFMNLNTLNTWWGNECGGTIQAPFVNVSGTKYYLSGVCTVNAEAGKTKCEESYTDVFENDEKFCMWIETTVEYPDPIRNQNVTSGCVVNNRVNCEDLTEKSSPSCQTVAGCRVIDKVRKNLNWLA